jgi:hypothetical protein
MKIDWSKAPEGATHCDESIRLGRWYKKEGNLWLVAYDGNWICSANAPAYNECLTPRPATPAWRGPQDGLPPVGTEVEAQDGYSWKTGTVVAHVWEACFGDMVIIQCEGFWASRRADGIRPVKPERERAIEEMVKVVEAANQLKTVKLVCNALYDAGYRKGEPT